MRGRRLWLHALWLACVAADCRDRGDDRPRAADSRINLPPDQQDAQTLGAEVYDLIDRAVAYRSVHRGRPAANLTQMGVESLTPTTVRRMVNLQREPVITVAYRRPEKRQIVSCRGDSGILGEATTNGGRFTLMCTSSSGAQRPMEVGELPTPE
ncbi:MAG: hypothetical protein K0S19_209 [Geminicoccaceae bacterium]|nr:hypothetical protein [Geminicoccaceae bacterium]